MLLRAPVHAQAPGRGHGLFHCTLTRLQPSAGKQVCQSARRALPSPAPAPPRCVGHGPVPATMLDTAEPLTSSPGPSPDAGIAALHNEQSVYRRALCWTAQPRPGVSVGAACILGRSGRLVPRLFGVLFRPVSTTGVSACLFGPAVSGRGGLPTSPDRITVVILRCLKLMFF